MTDRQMELLEESFAAVKPISMQVAKLFYQRLFELEPSLQRAIRGDRAEHDKRRQIGVAICALRRLDQILPVVAKLGPNPADGGVREEPYATVATALLWTLEQVLGDVFTSDVRAAWIAMYRTVSAVVQPGAMAESAA